jgi:hypothetical protein
VEAGRKKDRPGRNRIARIAIAAATAIVALNICTGAPLVALWVGSHVQADPAPTMEAIAVVVVVFAVLVLILVAVLGLLRDLYARSLGLPGRSVRRHVSWLRSMRGERPGEGSRDGPRLSAPDRIVVSVVVLAFLAFEIWFFFFAGSPLGGSGAL